MKSILFYGLAITQMICFIVLWIPSEYRRNILKEIIENQNSKNIKKWFLMLFTFLFFFILILNTLDSLPIHYVSYFYHPIHQLKRYFLFYFGMNIIVVLGILILNFFKTIHFMTNHPVYEKMLVCLLTTLIISLSRFWYREEILLFYALLLGIELILLVKDLKKETKSLTNLEYIYILFFHLSMTLYCSYILFAKIRVLLV